jgi:hypothetical protein
MPVVRSSLLAAAVCSLVLAGHAGAATPTAKKLQLTDAAGDANGVNDQGTGVGVSNGSPGPGSQPSKDILGVSYASTLVKKAGVVTCSGFTVTLKLAAPPDASGTLYRVDGKGVTDASLWWLQYDGATTKVRWSDGTSSNPLSSGSVALVNAAVVSGSSITFRVTESDLKASNERPKGFVISAPGADVRSVIPNAATVPQWDILPTDDGKTFKPC